MRYSNIVVAAWLSLLMPFLTAEGAFAQSNAFAARCDASAKKADVAIVEDIEEIRDHQLVRAKPVRTDKLGADIPHVYISVCVRVDSSGNVTSVDGAELSTYPAISDAATYEELAQRSASLFHFRPFVREGRPVAAELIEYVAVLPPEQRPDAQVPFPAIHDWQSLVITLRRTACLGTCPVYSVSIRGNGAVDYNGEGFVAIAGHHHAQISQQAVRRLFDEFRQADFFWLKPDYQSGITDNPAYELDLGFDGKNAEVHDYVGQAVGMPAVVTELEDAVDEVAGSQRWIVTNAMTIPSLVAEGWDFRGGPGILRGLAQYGTPEIVHSALDLGSPAAGRDGCLALQEAASKSNVRTMNVLLAAGAPIYSPAISKDFDGEECSVIAAAALSGDAGALGIVLRRHPDRRMMSSALLTVAKEGRDVDAAVIRSLVTAGADIEVRDSDGNTPLILANSSAEATRALIAAGANVNAKNNSGDTALLGSFTPDVIRVLAEHGADLNARNASGETALHRCVDESATRLLISLGQDVNARDNDGNTPLMNIGASTAQIKVLIAAGADVSARNNDGETALFTVLNDDSVKALLDAGADPWARNKDGKTALDVATEKDFHDNAAVLRQWMSAHPNPSGKM